MLLPLRASPAAWTACTEDNLLNAFRWLRNGSVRLDPVWTHTVRPELFAACYEALDRKAPDYLGVVVDWRDGNK
jgi:threonine dehydrogenase-like Zn-dependent dehydrogenase